MASSGSSFSWPSPDGLWVVKSNGMVAEVVWFPSQDQVQTEGKAILRFQATRGDQLKLVDIRELDGCQQKLSIASSHFYSQFSCLTYC